MSEGAFFQDLAILMAVAGLLSAVFAKRMASFDQEMS